VTGRPHRNRAPYAAACALVITAALSGAAGAARAQAPDTTAMPDTIGGRPITLDEAVTMARANAPGVIQAAGARRVAQVSRRTAWGEFIPSLSVSAGATRQLPSEGARTRIENGQIVLLPSQPWSHNIGLNANIDVFTGFRQLFNLQETGARLHAAKIDEVVQRYAATLAVKQSYFDVLAARESERAAQAQLASAQQQLDVAIGKVRARTATRSDSLRAEIQVRTGRIAVLDAQTALSVANASLTRTVGATEPVTAATSERLDIPEPPVDEGSLPTLAEQGPLIASALADLDAAKAARRTTWGNYMPTVTASYQRGGSGVGDEFLLHEEDLSYSGSMRFALNFPIFNQFQRELQGTQAAVAENNAQANLRDARLAVREGLATSVGNYRAARERVASQVATLEAADEDLRVQRQRYTVGGSTLLDVLASQSQLNQARLDLIRSQYDLRIARAQIEALVGRDL
jgi:outer membrane protein